MKSDTKCEFSAAFWCVQNVIQRGCFSDTKLSVPVVNDHLTD